MNLLPPRRNALRPQEAPPPLHPQGYDYRRAGAYYVTICVQDHLCLLGHISDQTMQLSAAGRMIDEVWHALPAHYPGVALDAFVLMPNHLHGLILLTNDPPPRTDIPPWMPPIAAGGPHGDGPARGPAPTGCSGMRRRGIGRRTRPRTHPPVHRRKSRAVALRPAAPKPLNANFKRPGLAPYPAAPYHERMMQTMPAHSWRWWRPFPKAVGPLRAGPAPA